MKAKLFTGLLLFTTYLATASGLYTSLLDVNDRWAFAKDLPPALYTLPAEENPIQTHLLLVSHILSARDVSHLDRAQQDLRNQLLKDLKVYAMAGNFPQNLIHSVRQPVFIDPMGNYCAVGHLIRKSGNDALSKKISANMNYAYLLNMQDDELQKWVQQSGFTAEELAWIQPGYPAIAPFVPLKGGLNGKVTSIKYEGNGELIVVGGFDSAGYTFSKGIAEYIAGFAGYDWIQTGGSGLVGEVFDVVEFNNTVVASGDFYMADTSYIASGVAYWNGNSWTGMGEFYIGAMVNTVYDLEIYNGDLYAAGFFKGDVATASPFFNIARWNGLKWEGLGASPDNVVKSLSVYKDKLILGGEFQNIHNIPFNYIAAYDTVNGFSQLSNGVALPVNDIEVLGDTIFIGGRFLNTFTQDTMGLAYFYNNNWEKIAGLENTNKPEDQEIMVLKHTPHGLFLGGNLSFLPMMGNIGKNILRLSNGILEPYAILDSTVLSLEYGDGHLYMGGHFTAGQTMAGKVELNHIAAANLNLQFSIEEERETHPIQIYPNPVKDHLFIDLNGKNLRPEFYDVLGKKIKAEGIIEGNLYKINTTLWPTGIYFLKVQDGDTPTIKIIKE